MLLVAAILPLDARSLTSPACAMLLSLNAAVFCCWGACLTVLCAGLLVRECLNCRRSLIVQRARQVGYC